MNTGKKPFSGVPSIAEGRQRDSSFKKAIRHLPARTKDNFLLLFLLLIGISGFAYILMVPVGQEMNKRSLFNKIFNPIQIESLTSNTLKSNFLKIDGAPNVNSPIVFSFSEQYSFEGYKMDFGDKIFADVASHQFVHAYTDPGTYKVELLKAGDEKDIVIHCEFIVIK